MFEKMRALVAGAAEPPRADHPEEMHMAVGALLVEAATMDTSFDDHERAAITRILSARFDLDGTATESLVEAATSASAASVELFGFTRKMSKTLEYEDRVHIIEMLWEVAYADGVLTAEEDALIRRVAGLIYVSDRDRGFARKRVLQKLGIQG